MLMICLSSTDSHVISGLTASLFVFLFLRLVHFAHFNPLPFVPMSFPYVILLLSRFSDKKLERGKWTFALIYSLSFSSILSSLSPQLSITSSLLLAVNLICTSFHPQGPSEIKLYTNCYVNMESLQWYTGHCSWTCISAFLLFLLKWL